MVESFSSFVITETKETILPVLAGMMSIIVFISVKAAERKENGPIRNRKAREKTCFLI